MTALYSDYNMKYTKMQDDMQISLERQHNGIKQVDLRHLQTPNWYVII